MTDFDSSEIRNPAAMTRDELLAENDWLWSRLHTIEENDPRKREHFQRLKAELIEQGASTRDIQDAYKLGAFVTDRAEQYIYGDWFDDD